MMLQACVTFYLNVMFFPNRVFSLDLVNTEVSKEKHVRSLREEPRLSDAQIMPKLIENMIQTMLHI